ncbi:hypothetical protein K505DRAFT_330513 [Melanomma pulvis-pyrius CBS 109.77]|uniref:Uncharacterized protein n=1 Tax=Melanomma pulvis-pyrius CBS 109.77 TaxID=1314802 RepID=A0A6A6WQK3_9PLEO|nr:hypothetical protein K505DRAFT_330513 [Melanomma pulvis-pyrius CBS 109.77]
MMATSCGRLNDSSPAFPSTRAHFSSNTTKQNQNQRCTACATPGIWNSEMLPST